MAWKEVLIFPFVKIKLGFLNSQRLISFQILLA